MNRNAGGEQGFEEVVEPIGLGSTSLYQVVVEEQFSVGVNRVGQRQGLLDVVWADCIIPNRMPGTNGDGP